MSEDSRRPGESERRADGPHRARHVATPFAGGSERAGAAPEDGPATLTAALLDRFRRVSLYNSPYAAHDRGRAVDLYPHPGVAPSPVAGEVTAVRSVTAPPKPYAAAEDHLIVIETDETEGSDGGIVTPPGSQVRVMHVRPGVEPGDRVAVGDSLGETVRSGYFAPWVGDHLHVGVRPPGANPLRATGSIPVALGPDVRIDALEWDGRGRVVETGDCYVALDAPTHPAPGERLAGIAARVGGPGGRRLVADGGLVHYDGGGVLAPRGSAGDGASEDGGPVDPAALAGDPVFVAGERVGTVTEDGRTVEWRDLTVRIDGREATGVSLYAGFDSAGAKVVGPDLSATVGDEVRVEFEPVE